MNTPSLLLVISLIGLSSCLSPSTPTGGPEPVVTGTTPPEPTPPLARTEPSAVPTLRSTATGMPPPAPKKTRQSFTEASEPLANCGLRMADHPYKRQVKTCCQGRVCDGYCSLWDGDRTPTCSCSSRTESCDPGTVCCAMTGTCTRSEDCLWYPGPP